MSARGDGSTGIDVPEGDPDGLRTSASQLLDVSGQLHDASSRLAATPSLMSRWAGPGSSAFAQLTSQESATLGSSALQVSSASFQLSTAADVLEDAQRRAQRAIIKAEQALLDIKIAREDIAEARRQQVAAKVQMNAAVAAREAAEAQLVATVVDSVMGDGTAAAAIAAADEAYRRAEQDLHEAERRERRAEHRLREAKEDLRDAREAGREANESAELMAVGLRVTLGALPAHALAMPGAPAREHVERAGGVRAWEEKYLAPREPVPISEQEPPENWHPVFKEWFKIGRGGWTAIDGGVDLATKAAENPERIPGAAVDLAENAASDPGGFLEAAVGYDELADGRYSDWLGQMGIGALTFGAGRAPAAVSRFNRVHGSPKLVPLGAEAMPKNAKFAGARMDFTKPDLRVPNGANPPSIPESRRLALAEKYPRGVRYTRAGYPVFTPYAISRVDVDGLVGDVRQDSAAANAAAGYDRTPQGYTWHHVENGRSMELVPRDLHQAARHTGGAAAIQHGQVGTVAPGGVFTPGESAASHAGGAAGAGAGAGSADEGRSP